MAELRKRNIIKSELKDHNIDIDELKFEGAYIKTIVSAIIKAFNKSESEINKIYKLALSDSFWTPKNIQYIYQLFGIPNKFSRQVAFIFNALNMYLVYAKLPTHVLILLDPGTRNNFFKTISQLFNKNPAPSTTTPAP